MNIIKKIIILYRKYVHLFIDNNWYKNLVPYATFLYFLNIYLFIVFDITRINLF